MVNKRWFILKICSGLIGSIIILSFCYKLICNENHNYKDIANIRYVVESEADRKEEEPLDAQIDKVWQAIPGYDGVRINKERTIAETMQADHINWVYEPISPNKNLKDLGPAAIYRGNSKKRAAGLMINVSWGKEYLSDILYHLKEAGAKATFFFEGRFIEESPDIVKLVAQEGHELANHAYSHPLCSKLTEEQIAVEIDKTEEALKKTIGYGSKWFAPPAGDCNNRVLQVAYKRQMGVTMFMVDTIDWRKDASPDIVFQRVNKGLCAGALVLAHPTEHTVKALPSILKLGPAKGLTWLTVSDLLSSHRC
ncbi:MAG: hypothetical protein RLZ12_154 [Bacillota bacterium]|jgi:probable sporulation protein (polysaccharide deacetylase family)